MIYGTSKDNESGFKNGFYNIYPVKKAVPSNQVIARYGDKRTSRPTRARAMPYFVISAPTSPKRIVWLGSSRRGGCARPRTARRTTERCWTKLLRYAGARTQDEARRRITLELGGPYKTDQFIEVDARILGKSGEALGEAEKPRIILKAPPGVDPRSLPSEDSLVMKPKSTGDGMFTVSFRLPSPGDYKVEVMVPSTRNTEGGTLRVEAANPETDDTRPDFTALYQMASEADERFLSNIPESAAPTRCSSGSSGPAARARRRRRSRARRRPACSSTWATPT